MQQEVRIVGSVACVLSLQDLEGMGNCKQHLYRHVDERRGFLWHQEQGDKGLWGLKGFHIFLLSTARVVSSHCIKLDMIPVESEI